ncbi:MAG: hypothetical protein ACYC8T_16480, partial [Myxococcaceae bacterium]
MRQTLALVLLLLAAGCGSPRLARSAGGLELEAVSLTLPDAFVGHSSAALLEVRNSSRGPRGAQLRASAPFSVVSQTV